MNAKNRFDGEGGGLVKSPLIKSSQELLPGIHEAEHKQKTQGPAHRVSGLCECMRCSSSLKAAWAECTCAGAARYIVRAWALLDICKRTVF